MTNVSSFRPNIPFSETQWVLASEIANHNDAGAWQEKKAEIERSPGVRRFQSALWNAVSEQPLWAERWAMRTLGTTKGTWLTKALRLLQQNPTHPLWPHLSLLLLAYLGNPENFGYHSGISEKIADAIDAKSPVILDKVILGLSTDQLSTIANIGQQILPFVLTQAALETDSLDSSSGEEQSCVAPSMLNVGPWENPGPFGLKSIFKSEWSTLHRDDIGMTAGAFYPIDDDNFPDEIHFRSVSSARDPDLEGFSLDLIPTPDVLTLWTKIENFRIVKTNEYVSELIIIGVGNSDKPTPVGLLMVSRSAIRGATNIHHIDLYYAYIHPDIRGKNLSAAFVTAIQHQFDADMHEYNKIVAPGAPCTVHITPDIGESESEWMLQTIRDSIEGSYGLLNDESFSEQLENGFNFAIKRGRPGDKPVELPSLKTVELSQNDLETFNSIANPVLSLGGYISGGPAVFHFDGSDVDVSFGYQSSIALAYDGPSEWVKTKAKDAAKKIRSRAAKQIMKKIASSIKDPGEIGPEIVVVCWFWGPYALMPAWMWYDIEGWADFADDLPIWLIETAGKAADREQFWRMFPGTLTDIIQNG